MHRNHARHLFEPPCLKGPGGNFQIFGGLIAAIENALNVLLAEAIQMSTKLVLIFLRSLLYLGRLVVRSEFSHSWLCQRSSWQISTSWRIPRPAEVVIESYPVVISVRGMPSFLADRSFRHQTRTGYYSRPVLNALESRNEDIIRIYIIDLQPSILSIPLKARHLVGIS